MKLPARYCIYLLFLCTFILCGAMANAQLSADFNTDNDGGCSPVVINFSNTSTGITDNTTYSWDFGNGNTSTLFSPGAVYSTAGTYTITLTVKDGNIISSKSKTISVYAAPTVNFSPSLTKGCLPLEITFTASGSAGSGTISDYYWDFGDGNTKQVYSSSFNHTYTSSLNASVSLLVTNSYGCTRVIKKDKLVQVLPAITSVFEAEKPVLCRVTDTVTFKNSSTGPGMLSYIWELGDGNTTTEIQPRFLYSSPGIYSVKLTVNSSDGCTAVTEKTDYMNVASFESDFDVPNPLCTEAEYIFKNISNPAQANSLWYINDTLASSNNEFMGYHFPDSGTYLIKLVNILGKCSDSVSKTVRVNTTPAVHIFSSDIVGKCGIPVTVAFQDTTQDIAKWEWNFDAERDSAAINAVTQKPSFNYIAYGSYIATLKVANAAGCSATISKFIDINKPSAYIKSEGVPTNCGPYSIAFSAVREKDSIINYNWDFGDGSFSSDPAPVHLFNDPGNFSVKLIYTTLAGCTDSVWSGVYVVYKTPTAAFTVSQTTVCGDGPVTFTAIPQEGVSFIWDFGDGYNIAGQSSIIHQYKYDSSFTIRLLVRSITGCTDTVTKVKYITVLPPFAKITSVKNTCNNDRGTVDFTQQSRKVEKWEWDFGDGNATALNTNQTDVAHQYLQTGKYRIVLAASNSQCTIRDTIYTAVLLKQNPVLSAGKTSVCLNEELNFSVNNLEVNPYLNTNESHYGLKRSEYSDMSDYGGTVTKADTGGRPGNQSYSGTFSGFEKEKKGIRLILQSAIFGCADTTNILPLDIKWSQAGYSIADKNICLANTAFFNDTSATNNSIIERIWDFGDSNIQVLKTEGIVHHKYANPGSYKIKLSVQDIYGCRYNSEIDSIVIKGPKADFIAPGSSFITFSVLFNNKSNTYGVSNTKYNWLFGDGATSTAISPSYAYSNPGDYKIKLTATDAVAGCSDTLVKTLTIKDFKPGFTLNKYYLSPKNCPPVLVKLTNTSINYTSVKWDFGDGSSVESINAPSHIYVKPGKYIITLNITGPRGITAQHKDSVTIKGPDAFISTDKKEICAGETIHFTAVAKNTISYTWDLGDGTIAVNADSLLSHQYNVPGKYKPFLIISDAVGCSFSPGTDDSIIVRNKPVVTFSALSPICRGATATITVNGNYTYKWAAADGINDLSRATINVSPLVSSEYKLKVSDNLLCSSDTSILVTVIQPLQVKIAPASPFCINKATSLQASGADKYQWISFTNGLSNTATATPSVSGLQTGNYTYSVSGTDKYNCFSDTASVTVSVTGLPEVDIKPAEKISYGTPVQLMPVVSNDVVNWQWSPAKYLNCTNCQFPVSKPEEATTYTLTVTNTNGCTISKKVSIDFLCKESSVLIPSAFSPNNDGVNDILVIKGIATVNWLQVYNRMGNLVFERKNFKGGDRSAGWDGYYKGNLAEPGTYSYFTQIKCPEGSSFIKKGTIVLIR